MLSFECSQKGSQKCIVDNIIAIGLPTAFRPQRGLLGLALGLNGGHAAGAGPAIRRVYAGC